MQSEASPGNSVLCICRAGLFCDLRPLFIYAKIIKHLRTREPEGVIKAMADKYTREIIDLIRSVQAIDYIAPEDIPDIDLYMDQVTTFMDEHLKSSKRFDEDKILTKTMINNYTKNNLLPPSDKKKYSKEHMVLLIFIYYFKNFLSINDIKSILEPLSSSFFQSKGDFNLNDIYQEIFDLQLETIDTQVRDLIRKLKKSGGTFSEIAEEEERKKLTNFAFICMLSFDIWVKKTIIENMIDKKPPENTTPGKKL